MGDDKIEAFRDFERDGWNEVAGDYARVAASSTATAAEALLDAARVKSGQRVLDIASGPGWVAAAARERGAEVVGLDISSAMVEVASQRYPDIRFEVGEAEALPFDDASFDVVVTAFGMPHFADHRAVFSEIHRVLAPGGRVAASSWNAPDKNPFFAIALGSIAAHGSLDVPLPEGVDMFSWADDAVCAELFASTGFGQHDRTEIPIVTVSDDGPAAVLDVLENASVRSRALFQAQTEEARAAIREGLAERLEPFRDGDTWTVLAAAFAIAADRA